MISKKPQNRPRPHSHQRLRSRPHEVCLILDNIRSVFNAGSIFRTAETLAISKIYCAGTTPLPVDRFGRKRQDFAKVSLGAENLVSWEHIRSASRLADRLRSENCLLIALEQSPRAIDYKKVDIRKMGKGKNRVAVILGNEIAGVSGRLIKKADIVAEIPMLGKKESLNVAVAAAVFLFRILDR